MRRNRITLFCAQCNQPFEVVASESSAKYCSRACHNLGRVRPPRPCAHCGKVSVRGQERFCSIACGRLARNGPPEARFRSRVAWQEEDCCLWTGGKQGDGYGVFRPTKDSPVMLAHRYAYLLYHGELPDAEICHTCDNPACVREDHLFAGTHQENMTDSAEKGRMHGNRPMNANTVRQMRALAGTMTQKDIAARFGVTRSNTHAIIARRSWKHVA